MAASKCLLLCTLLIMGMVVTPTFAARAHLRDAKKAGLRGRELQATGGVPTTEVVAALKQEVEKAGVLINAALSPLALSKAQTGRKLSQTPQIGSLGVVGPLLLGIVNPLLAGVDQLLGGLLTALGAPGPSVPVCPTCGVLNGLDLKTTLTPALGKVNDLLGVTLTTVIGPNKLVTTVVNSLSNPSLVGNIVNQLLSGPLRAGAGNPNVDPANIPAGSVNELTAAVEILKDVIGKVDGALGGCGPLPTLVNNLLRGVVTLVDGLLGGLLIGLVGTTVNPLLKNVLGTVGAGNC